MMCDDKKTKTKANGIGNLKFCMYFSFLENAKIVQYIFKGG